MSLKQNLDQIHGRMAAACKRTGRSPKDAQLLAVSKRQSLQTIQQAFDLGLRHFGENYVQEALEKQQQLNFPELHWHFIGHLQSNKVKDVIGNFDYIHSVDRLSLAQKLNKVAVDKGVRQKIFLQVNLAAEGSKAGVSEDLLESLFFEVVQLEGLQTCGLMIMPPFAEDAEQSRQFFSKGKHLLQLLKSHAEKSAHKEEKLTELSMGTSQDFEVAIEEGATWIRLGSILLGEREK